jgi:hypothetical protein
MNNHLSTHSLASSCAIILTLSVFSQNEIYPTTWGMRARARTHTHTEKIKLSASSSLDNSS